MGNRARIRRDAMSLNPIDDALFQKMAEDTGFCQEILQVILNDKALQVMDNVPQFMLKNLQGRSCILDVKCTLGDGRSVNAEVQKSDNDDHQRRDVAAAVRRPRTGLRPTGRAPRPHRSAGWR